MGLVANQLLPRVLPNSTHALLYLCHMVFDANFEAESCQNAFIKC